MVVIMHYLAVALLVLNFGSFFWSVFGVFSRHPDFDRKNYRLLQINSLLLYFSCLYFLFIASPSTKSLVVYNFILSLCLVGFWYNSKLVKNYQFSIVFSRDLPKKILKLGLYRFIRHPYYLIYNITYFSTALITKNIFVLLLSMSMLALYYKAAKFEEKKISMSPLKEEYLDYMKTTGMFLPKIYKKIS